MGRFVFLLLAAAWFLPLGSFPAAYAGDGPVWRLDAAYTRSSFSRRDQDDWHEETLALTRTLEKGRALGVFAASERRYGQDDPTIGALWATPVGPGVNGAFRLSATPDADFLPRWTAEAAFDGRAFEWGGAVGGPLVLTLVARHKDYAAGDVDNLNPGLVQYLAKGRVWLSAAWINGFEDSIGKRLGGHSFRADWQATDRLRLFAGHAFAPEADSGKVVDITTRFAGIAYDVSDVTAVRLDYAREDRENSYLRNVLSIGLVRRF